MAGMKHDDQRRAEHLASVAVGEHRGGGAWGRSPPRQASHLEAKRRTIVRTLGAGAAFAVAAELAVVLSLEAAVDGAGAAAAAAPLLDPNGALVGLAAGGATLDRPVGELPLAVLARAASRSLRSRRAASCLA